MSVVLIDSPVANTANILRALREVGASVERSHDPSGIAAARKLVLPGVGSFAAAMGWLMESGVAPAIREAVRAGASLLGICVGHQLLFESSEEMGQTAGLGLCRGQVMRFPEDGLPIPQIGWNRVHVDGDPLFDGIPDETAFYFVNSFRAIDVPPDEEIATAVYGERFNVAVRAGTVRGLQFHPEKSGEAGLRVLRNWVERA